MIKPLQFVGAAADHHQRRVAIIALHRKIFRVSIAAQDAHRLERHFSRSLGGEQLGHAGFQIAALAAILFLGRGINQQARGFDARGHVGQLDLNGLVLRDRFAERGPALRVANGFFESRARNPQPACRHVDAFRFQARHHLLEAFASPRRRSGSPPGTGKS